MVTHTIVYIQFFDYISIYISCEVTTSLTNMTDYTFHCQKCSIPIKLDESLLRLSPAQLNLLINKNHNHTNDISNNAILNSLDYKDFIGRDKVQLYEAVNTSPIKSLHYRNLIESDSETDTDELSSNSYVVLSDEDEPEIKITQSKRTKPNQEENHSILSRIKALNNIFEMLSSNQDIQHPLSQDCATLLIENYKLKFDQSQREKEQYLSFLKKLKEKDFGDIDLDLKINEGATALEKLTEEEKLKLEELAQLEEVKKELEKELEKSKEELGNLNKNDLTDLFKLKNLLQLDLDTQVNKLEQFKASYKMHLNHLDKLRNLNIYSEIFNISFNKEDKHSTINGFRLGYRIVGSEINAALGQIVLLLIFLVKRLKVKLDSYVLIALGSQSKIIKWSASNVSSANGVSNTTGTRTSNVMANPTDGAGSNGTSANGTSHPNKTKTVLNLFTSNEFSLGKLFNFNKLDVAMIALLDVVSQIEAQVCSIDPEIELPYKISPKKDHIGGKSIRFTSNNEWTEGCTFLLTNLNWVLSYTSALT